MNDKWNRRQVLKRIAAASAGLMLPRGAATSAQSIRSNEKGKDDIEIQIAAVSERTFRLTILPVKDGRVGSIPFNGSLVKDRKSVV